MTGNHRSDVLTEHGYKFRSIVLFLCVYLPAAARAQQTTLNDRITAVYDYHKAFTSLENAVGHPLR